jgi:protease-4
MMQPRWLLAALITLPLSGCFIGNFDLSAFGSADALEETVVKGESGPKLVMLQIEGMISDTAQSTRLGAERPSMVARAREALDRAAEDDDVAGLLLRIQSPGGTVSASETLYHELAVWKEENQKPVVAYLQGLATSGGYYVAMAADEVIAHPTTVTGSVGVIMRGINVSKLMDNFGVSDQSFKSGTFKDAASPLRPMREEERKQLQSVVDDLHGRFIEVVLAGRPALDPASVTRLSDGRVFTANQALEAGLIDHIGHLEQAIEAAEKRAEISESRVVMYRESVEYLDNIYSHSPLTPQQVINIDILSLVPDPVPPGFYYLWPSIFK